MTTSGYEKRQRNVLRCFLNIASNGADVTSDGMEVCSRSWRRKSPFANGGQVERQYCKLVDYLHFSLTSVHVQVVCLISLGLLRSDHN